MTRLSGCGLGLRKEHFETILRENPPVPFWEALSENFMVAGGRPRRVLEAVRRSSPVLLHGVSLSIGSAEPLDRAYLARLEELVRWIQPETVSDHLCWTALGGANSHDLLPLPFTEAAVARVADKVGRVQDALGRPLLLENVSSYVAFRESTMSEAEFVSAVVRRSGCRLLLDVNNLYVNARNQGFSTEGYLATLPKGAVAQIHLAGHDDQGDVVVDTHDRDVAESVWRLYRLAIARFGDVPTIIERDARVPPLADLLREARRAESILEEARSRSRSAVRPGWSESLPSDARLSLLGECHAFAC
ncbi:MAG: DUF692 domain-containing protein [Acidobacteria bacterium]|nr:DUF692 domain-containing protein [Acidobacteriota bacterium]